MDLNATEHRKLIDLWLEGPAENAPHGTTTDYLNGPSLHKYGVLCQSIFLTLTTVLILIRIYTKTRILKSLGWDDCKYLFTLLAGIFGHLINRLLSDCMRSRACMSILVDQTLKFLYRHFIWRMGEQISGKQRL